PMKRPLAFNDHAKVRALKSSAIVGSWFLAAAVLAQPAVPPGSAASSNDLSRPAILATLKQAADWQCDHPASSKERYGEQAWTYGAFYAGLMALSRIADTPKYHDWMIERGRKLNWQPGPRRYYADDYCVSQAFLELFLQDHDPAMLGPTKTNFDFILEHPATNDLHMGKPHAQDRWNWCDALFMG